MEKAKKNPFDNRILENIQSTILSPNLMKILPSPKEKGWAIEHTSTLCPANITDEEIRLSRSVSDPEFEEEINQRLEIYWKSGVGYVPSPDGPRPIVLESPVISCRSGSIVTPMVSAVRKRYESPAARPAFDRKRFVTMRNAKTQTDVSIPTNLNFDFAKILGEQFSYKETENEEEEEEFNVSLNSSMPRRLIFQDESFAESSFSKEDDTSSEKMHDLDGSASCCPELGLDLDLSPIRAE